MNEDAADARRTITRLFVGGVCFLVVGLAVAASGEDSSAAGYLIAALASPAVTVGVVAYAVSLGVRASR